MTGTSGALKLGPNPNRAGSAEAYDVLLVEDVPVSKKIAFMALKKQKYSVAMVSSGEEAIEVYKKAHPNIVLMDIQLPGMNGIETTKLIRQEEAVSNLKPAIIFALTSSVSANDLQQYKDMKLNGCIAKGELLVQSLKRAMEDLAADPGAFVACVNKDSK